MKRSTFNAQRSTLNRMERVAQRTMEWKFRVWGFGEAIALRGLLAAGKVTGNSAITDFVHALLREYVNGEVGRAPEEHVAPGSELLLLYQDLGDERFLEAARKLAALHGSFPKNSHGARMHRPDLPGWREQIWVDCMDSEPPFLARLGAITGEDKYFDRATEELLAYARLLQDDETGLFFHGYESACGVNGQRWARGNGWALLGIGETLRFLPKEHDGRGELMERLHRLCSGLRRTQDGSGLWHTVLTDSETYLESTLAAMTAYALREAFDAALLAEDEFADMEKRARTAALSQIDEDGALQRVTDATPVAEPKMYATRAFGVFPWGQGPLLLMLAQDGGKHSTSNVQRSTFNEEHEKGCPNH